MSDRNSGFQYEYVSGLETYLKTGDESALSRAYELGRRAMVDGLGILDMAILHRVAFDAFVISAPASDQPRLAARQPSFTSCSRHSRCPSAATAEPTKSCNPSTKRCDSRR